MEDAIEQWESEGGACSAAERLNGTDGHVNRPANVFSTEAFRQAGQKGLDAECSIGILECLRAELITREAAGYFVRDWQELRHQVRRMIGRDFPAPADRGGENGGGRDRAKI